ncbi:MAG: hypothetical protein RLZZ273_1232 [Bacteroidota bacterium]
MRERCIAFTFCIITYFLIVGCEEVVSETRSARLTIRQANELVDSTVYHLSVSERIDRALVFLEKLQPHSNASPDLLLKYRALLVDAAWNTGNYQDIISIAHGSLYRIAVRGENRTGTDATMMMMSAHALKKLGDTATAVKLYQVLAASEYLAMRRGAQANLLTLYSKRGEHRRAIDLAKILEHSEMMNPTDLSAHINREYYWGRSLFLTGDKRSGEDHLRKVVGFLNNLRPNSNRTELRVRMQTARNILNDVFMSEVSSRAIRDITALLHKSLLIDSLTLHDRFRAQEAWGGGRPCSIPTKLFPVTVSMPALLNATTVDTAVITSTTCDERGARWFSTLFGLYLKVGQQFAYVKLPQHNGVIRPIRSVCVANQFLHIRSYTGDYWKIRVDSLVHNYSSALPTQSFFTCAKRSSDSAFRNEPIRLTIDDSTEIVGGPENAYLVKHTQQGKRRIEIPSSNDVPDTVLAVFQVGDSVIIYKRTEGPRLVRRELLAKGMLELLPFDYNKALYRMALPRAVTEIAAKQIMAEYPATMPVSEELHPTTLQRALITPNRRLVVIRTHSILVAFPNSNELRVVEWPDSVTRSLYDGFYPSVTSDSTVRIVTRESNIDINLNAIQRRPMAGCLLAAAAHDHVWIGWLDGNDRVVTGDSISFALGSTAIVSDYLNSVDIKRSWTSDTLQDDLARTNNIDLPNTRACTMTVDAAGVVTQASIVFEPDLYPLLYQDVWIILTVLLAGGASLALVTFWSRVASSNRKMLEHQHNAIARDLHDTLGADLARLTALLNASDTRQSRDIANAALAANRKFRSLLWIWRSDSIRLNEFAGELREYVTACLADAQIQCTSRLPDLSEDSFVDASTAKNVLIILNESITNVIRHSQASEVELTFTYHDGTCTTVLSDNGMGFDATNLERKSGILNIPIRAEQNGFIAEVISEPLSGTTILISFGVH